MITIPAPRANLDLRESLRLIPILLVTALIILGRGIMAPTNRVKILWVCAILGEEGCGIIGVPSAEGTHR
jgi:hypothetical protein